MLIQFSVENFRSFKELQTLTMVAANIRSRPGYVDEQNVAVAGKYKLLKSKAIYGANASGKSNLARAFFALTTLLRLPVRKENPLPTFVERFLLSTTTDEKPTYFQIMLLYKEVMYRYGFEVKDGHIYSEWLFATPKRQEVMCFLREGMEIEVNPRMLKEKEVKVAQRLAEKGSENDIIRPHSLFLKGLASLGVTLATELVQAILNIRVMNGLNDPIARGVVAEKMTTPAGKQSLLELLKAADLSLNDIETKLMDKDNLPDGLPDEVKQLIEAGLVNLLPNFETRRPKFDADNQVVDMVVKEMDEWESEGTKKFLGLAAILLEVLDKGYTLVIDEFDSSLHPNLTEKVVELFHSTYTNPRNAQLIFVSHDSNLINSTLLRRDQICLVEKDDYGSSTLFDLSEFKGVRNDERYDKNYLSGSYGAVPFLNRLDNVVEQQLVNESR